MIGSSSMESIADPELWITCEGECFCTGDRTHQSTSKGCMLFFQLVLGMWYIIAGIQPTISVCICVSMCSTNSGQINLYNFYEFCSHMHQLLNYGQQMYCSHSFIRISYELYHLCGYFYLWWYPSFWYIALCTVHSGTSPR